MTQMNHYTSMVNSPFSFSKSPPGTGFTSSLWMRELTFNCDASQTVCLVHLPLTFPLLMLPFLICPNSGSAFLPTQVWEFKCLQMLCHHYWEWCSPNAIPPGDHSPHFQGSPGKGRPWTMCSAHGTQKIRVSVHRCCGSLQTSPVLLCSWEGETQGYQKLPTAPCSGDRHLLENRRTNSFGSIVQPHWRGD